MIIILLFFAGVSLLSFLVFVMYESIEESIYGKPLQLANIEKNPREKKSYPRPSFVESPTIQASEIKAEFITIEDMKKRYQSKPTGPTPTWISWSGEHVPRNKEISIRPAYAIEVVKIYPDPYIRFSKELEYFYQKYEKIQPSFVSMYREHMIELKKRYEELYSLYPEEKHTKDFFGELLLLHSDIAVKLESLKKQNDFTMDKERVDILFIRKELERL